MKVELDRIAGRGFPGSGGERKGSRKFGRISDGFGVWLVKWQRGQWKIVGTRWQSKVTTSLQTRQMVAASEAGREVPQVARYTDFSLFAKRLAAIVGEAEALRIVQWIRS